MNEIYSQFNTSQLILIGHENFAVWQLAVEALLATKGWLGAIIGDPSQPTDPTIDVLARKLIVDSIEASNYIHIMYTRTAKEAWDELRKVFGGSGLTRKIGILKSMTPIHLKDFPTMEQYIDYTIKASLKIRRMGIEMSDECIGMQLLAGLTNDYWKLIVELDRTKAIVTPDFVKALLLNQFPFNKTLKTFNDNSPFRSNEHCKTKIKIPIPSANTFNVDSGSNDRVKDGLLMTKNSKDSYHRRGSSNLSNLRPEEAGSSSGYSSPSSGVLSPRALPTRKDLEVEVLGGHGGYYEGYVSDVFEDSVEITFGTEYLSTVNSSFIDVRLVSHDLETTLLQKGEDIEVRTRISDSHPWGWWRAKIARVIGNGYVVVEIPGWLGSKFGHDECVEVGRVRTPNRNGPISSGMFHKREILVPEEQRESAKSENVHRSFKRAIGAASCRYVPERGVLLLISRNDNLKSLGSWINEKVFGEKPVNSDCAGQCGVAENVEPRFYTFF